MKKQFASLVSKTVLSIAKSSATVTCTWLTYQPKLPKQLTK